MIIIHFLNQLEYLDSGQIIFNPKPWNTFGQEMLPLRRYLETVFYLDTVYMNQYISILK